MNPTADPTMTGAREETPDVLKGIAVLFMILVHILEEFSTPDVYASSVGHMVLFFGGPPAAPVFMAVMGYLLAATARPTISLLRRGLLLVGGGILLNIGLNLNLLIAIAKGKFALDPLAYIFGADILPLAGLSVIILVLLRPVFRQSALSYALLAAMAASLAPVLPQLASDDSSLPAYISAFLWGERWWSYFPLFPWLAYPAAGYVFGILRRRVDLRSIARPGYGILAVTVALVGFVVTVEYASAVTSELPDYYHHTPLFAAWAMFFLLGWTLLVSLLNRQLGSTRLFISFKWLGRNVTTVYVFQWLLIGNIATGIYQTQSMWQSLLWFLAMLGGASALTILWQKARKRIATAPASSAGF